MLRKIKKVVCYSFSLNNIHDADAMGHLRIVAPYTIAGIEIVPGIVNNQIIADLVKEADMVVIQRNFPVKFKDYQKIVGIANREGIPVVYDLDDLFFLLPEDHPDRVLHHFTSSLFPMLQAVIEADLVTVTTPKLGEILSQFAKRVAVIPNYLDDNIWNLKDPQISTFGKLIIGYMGTNSHRPDLLQIFPVLSRLKEKYQEKIGFRFWGIEPIDELQPSLDIEWYPFHTLDYRKFVEFFLTQQADIFIAPLVDNLFNRCKSPIKFFEYSALGSPVVFSSIEPYSNIVENGVNGFLASSLQEWEIFLSQLIESNELRVNVALKAQRSIKDKWLLSKNVNIILETLQSAKVLYTNEYNHRLDVILGSLNLQLYEYFNILNGDIQKYRIENDNLRIENDNLRIENKELEEEILSYILTHSWKLTRPFRKIGKKLNHFR
jgi:glycosyltransferase involved in cell wall biosynthesis